MVQVADPAAAYCTTTWATPDPVSVAGALTATVPATVAPGLVTETCGG